VPELIVDARILRRPPGRELVGAIAGRALALLYRLTGKSRYDDFRLEHVGGMPMLVTPSVFNPKVPRTGAFLAAQLDASRVSAATRVLDLGTGAGIGALFAARHARRVVATDINPEAVRCAALNALLNHLEHRIEVRHGDLFAPVSGERFDLVLFNPPFLIGTPRDDRDRAWRSLDVAERFAAGLAQHLTADGRALVLLSSFGDAGAFIAQFRAQRLEVRVIAERGFINETLAVFELRSPGRVLA